MCPSPPAAATTFLSFEILTGVTISCAVVHSAPFGFRPQPYTSPVVAIATADASASPVEATLTAAGRIVWTATFADSCLLPLPSCPRLFGPTAYSAPSATKYALALLADT